MSSGGGLRFVCTPPRIGGSDQSVSSSSSYRPPGDVSPDNSSCRQEEEEEGESSNRSKNRRKKMTNITASTTTTISPRSSSFSRKRNYNKLHQVSSNTTTVLTRSNSRSSNSTTDAQHKLDTTSTSPVAKKMMFKSNVGNNNSSSNNSNKMLSSSAKIILPHRFLLGGNISDPLNLASFDDGSAVLQTPKSSPMPTPKHKKDPVNVMIPVNLNDPLNLEEESATKGSGDQEEEDGEQNLYSRKDGEGDVKEGKSNATASREHQRRKAKQRKRKRSESESSLSLVTTNADDDTCINNDTKNQQNQKEEQIIINPSSSSSLSSLPSTSSSTATTQNTHNRNITPPTTLHHHQQHHSSNNSRLMIVSPAVPQGPPLSLLQCKYFGLKRKTRRRTIQQQQHKDSKRSEEREAKDRRFRYGNYDRYYQYRNPQTHTHVTTATNDVRIQCLRHEWFAGREVLDIGSNVGSVTIAIAKLFGPKLVIGIDLDDKLIREARLNVTRVVASDVLPDQRFPQSFNLSHRGPLVPTAAIASLPFAQETTCDADATATLRRFPDNILFACANYVLSSDQMLDQVEPEYDTILLMSVTKWIHLNWGDEGLKRTFKRIFKQLRSSSSSVGRFILEPQPWKSYIKKKNICPETEANFRNIRFRPEDFKDYLLSAEVGFDRCELVGTPENKSKGFRRPIYCFIKQSSAEVKKGGEDTTATVQSSSKIESTK